MSTISRARRNVLYIHMINRLEYGFKTVDNGDHFSYICSCLTILSGVMRNSKRSVILFLVGITCFRARYRAIYLKANRLRIDSHMVLELSHILSRPNTPMEAYGGGKNSRSCDIFLYQHVMIHHRGIQICHRLRRAYVVNTL